MINFKEEWLQAYEQGELATSLMKEGLETEATRFLAAKTWMTERSNDLARNWLADTALTYLQAVMAGEPIPLKVAVSIQGSLSYPGNWIRHLVTGQPLLDETRPLKAQWKVIEEGVAYFLSLCKKPSVPGLMIEVMECALEFSNMGIYIDTQRLIEVSYEALAARAPDFCSDTKSPAFVMFCPSEWPPLADKQSLVGELTQFMLDQPERVSFFKKARGKALTRLFDTYPLQTLAPVLSERQLEDKLSTDLGL